MMKIRVGGVPEHFNYPWHNAIQKGKFQEEGIDIEWIDFPGGTGAMAQAMANKEIDFGVLLTEGAVAAIARGLQARILHFMVKSPLVWGIHTGYHSNLHSLDDIKGKRFAISRFGSGSHLMSKVLAYQNNLPFDHMEWVEVKNLDGAEKSLTNLESDVFLWEKFMTKPYVDKKIFRKIGEIPTPWPAFSLLANLDIIQNYASMVSKISSIILEEQKEIKNEINIILKISQKYHLQENDIKNWIKITDWEYSNIIENKEFNEIIKKLQLFDILDRNLYSTEQFVHLLDKI
jgi:sulfonate transport system substrate-binding protein